MGRRTGARAYTPARDAGSMPLAVLVVICGIGLSLTMGASVLTQLAATRTDTGRLDALNGAQSGLQAVAAHVRSAVSAAGAGRVDLLPCAEKTGSVGGLTASGGSLRAVYQVRIEYYRFDPARTTDNPVLACQPGSGPTTLPGYVMLTSTGSDGRSNGTSRTIRATYRLHTAAQGIPGGLIRVWKMPTAPYDLRLDAGAVMPTAASPGQLRVQKCDSQNPQQVFAYTANLNLVYVASKSDTYPLGMCLDAGATPADAAPVQLRPCATVTARQQQWSYTATRNFVGITAAGDPDDLCFNLEGGVVQPNTRVVVRQASAGGCYAAADNDTQMFTPEAAVGAGAAESSAYQLVNFAQFSRCIDVTGDNVGTSYLTSYPCQQVAAPRRVTWDQRFTIPTLATSGGTTSGTGRIFTDITAGDHEASNRTGRYCLAATRPYVTVGACPLLVVPTTMQWKVVRTATDYASAYRIETGDNSNTCLAAASAVADLTSAGTSKIVVEPCSESLFQKWNAPAYSDDASPLTTVREN